MSTANIESSNIKVFPSNSRGSTTDGKLINPESFLNTEFNLTTLVRRLNKSSYKGKENGFVIESTTELLTFSLCGYWFEISCPSGYNNVGAYLADKDKLNNPSSIYAVITLEHVDSGYDGVEFEVLGVQENDSTPLDNNGKFLGITFVDSIEGGLENNQYSLLLYVLKGSEYIVPTSSLTSISSNYILDYQSVLPITEQLTLEKLDVTNCLKFESTDGTLFLLDENNWYADVSSADFTIKNGDTTLETISKSSKLLDYDNVMVKSDLNIQNTLRVVDNVIDVNLDDSSKKFSVYGASGEILEQIKWDNSRFVKDISIPYNNKSTFTNNNIIENNVLIQNNGSIQLSDGVEATTSGIVLDRSHSHLITEKGSTIRHSDLIHIPNSNINCYTLTATEIKATNTAQIGSIQAGSITVTEEINAPEITATGTITAKTFNATSDARLKENLSAFKYEKSILDLPTYEYNFKGQEQRTIGVLAQDLLQLYPNLVHLGKDGFYSIEENKLIYLLKEEVRALKEEITQLKEEVEKIKRK